MVKLGQVTTNSSSAASSSFSRPFTRAGATILGIESVKEHQSDRFSANSEGPDDDFIHADQYGISGHSLIASAIDDSEAHHGWTPTTWNAVYLNNVTSTVIGCGGTWTTGDVFAKNSPYVPQHQDDADARQYSAEDQMHESLQ